MTRSAGIIPYRCSGNGLQVMLVHPGGPFWAGKDDGAWSIAKGLVEDGEDLATAARREFLEETGFAAEGEMIDLGSLRQPSRKVVHAFALTGDFDCTRIKSNHFSMEWPPKSGETREFPEVDRAEWFDMATARVKILPGQREFLDRLEQALDRASNSGA